MWKHAQSPFMKRTRKRYCLRPETARALLHAERFARALGKPLTLFITIKFALPSRTGQSAYKIFSQYLWGNTRRRWNTMMKKAQTPDPFMATAVFENPLKRVSGNRRFYGPYHVHWMMRWPLKDKAKLEYYLRKHMRKRFHLFKQSHLRITGVWDSIGAAKYMAKGIDAAFAENFYVKHRAQGPIHHRRIIVTRSLGKAAQKKGPKNWKQRRPSYRMARPLWSRSTSSSFGSTP